MTQNGTPRKLTTRQLAFLRLLIEGRSIQAAARAVKSSRTTCYRWMRQDEFKHSLSIAKGEVFAAAIVELKVAALAASRKLVSLVDSKSENTARLTAVEILEANFRIVETENLDARLTKLEKTIKRHLGPRGMLSQVPDEARVS